MHGSFFQSRGLRSIACYLFFVSAHSSEACAPFTSSNSSRRSSLEGRSAFDESLVLRPDDFVHYSANLTCGDDPSFAGTGPAAVVQLIVTPPLRLTVSTCGAGLDTDLTVLTPTSCQPLACSGDAPVDKPRCQSGYSAVDFTAPSDGVIYLLVQPYANVALHGNATMRVTGSAPPPCRAVIGVFTSGQYADEVHWGIDDAWIEGGGPNTGLGPYPQDGGGTRYSTDVGCLAVGDHTFKMYAVYGEGWFGGTVELSYADAQPGVIDTFTLTLEDGFHGDATFTVTMLSPFAPPDPPAPPGPPPMTPAPPSAPPVPAFPPFPTCECEYGVRLEQKIPVGTAVPTVIDAAGMPELSCAGAYVKDGQRTPDGRQVYKKSGSSEYMYWWAEYTNWRVGFDITESAATCASWSDRDGPCPEQASQWRQIAGTTFALEDSEYRPDITLRIECLAPPGAAPSYDYSYDYSYDDSPSPLAPPPAPFQPPLPPLPPWSPAPDGMVLATSAVVLQELLSAAAAGEPLSIFLPEGLMLSINEKLVVNDDTHVTLTSAGAGATLDGGGAAAALFVVRNGGSLSLTRIHMQNVRESLDAGITVGQGASLSLRHSSMSDMTAKDTAGCISVEGSGGGSILIEDSVLENCEDAGGGRYGGCIYHQFKRLFILRSVLDGCRSSNYGNGGAAAGGGGMDVINSTITNSFAAFEGGAFFTYNAPVTISGSRLQNCSSGWASGALGSESSASTEFHVTDSEILSCSTYGPGGIFRAPKGSKFSLTRVYVSNCIAWLSGGAVNVEARSLAVIKECNFEDCTSEANGGAVHVEGSLDMQSTKITRCFARTNGGGLSAKGGVADLVNVQFIDCGAGTDAGALEASDASTVTAWRLTVVASAASWYGHAILVERSQLMLTIVDFLQQPCDGSATIHAAGLAIGEATRRLRKVSIEGASCYSGGARLLSYERDELANSTDLASCDTEAVCGIGANCRMVRVQASSADSTPECSCQLPFIPPRGADGVTAAYVEGCVSPPRGKSLQVVADELQLSVTKTESGDNTIGRNLTLTLLGTDPLAAASSWVARDTGNVPWLSLPTSSATELTGGTSPWEVTIEVEANATGLAETAVGALETSIEVHVQANANRTYDVSYRVPILLHVKSVTSRAAWGVVTSYNVSACASRQLAQQELIIGEATAMEFTACDHEDIPVSHRVPTERFTVRVTSHTHAPGGGEGGGGEGGGGEGGGGEGGGSEGEGSAIVEYSSAPGRYDAMVTVTQLGNHTVSLFLNGRAVGVDRTVTAVCQVGLVELTAEKRCGCAAGREIKGTTCVPCAAGTFKAEASSDECEKCAPGKYVPSTGATECLSCPASTYSAAGAERCLECSHPLTSPGASAACTYCVENYYLENDHQGDVECLRCPIGSACEESGNTLALLSLLPGYWRTSNQSSDLRRCPDASLQGKSACSNKNGQLCKPWTTGPYCRVCNVTDGSRYFDSGQSACVECGDTAVTSLATLIGITLVVLLMLCWCGWRIKSYKRLRFLAYQALEKIRAPLKQMVAFYQIVTRVESVFKVVMPASVAALLNVFDSLNLSIDAFGVPLSCLQLGSFFDQLLFLVLLPGVLGLLTLGCSLGFEVLIKSEAASLKAGVIRALPYLLHILFFAFPLVSSRAFQALDCEEFDDGTRFLRADYSLDCNDAEHRRVFFLAWVAIALYPLGVPLLYLIFLLCARKAILTEHPTALSRSLTFLHQDYELSMYWWEMVEISKKLFLVGFCVLIRPGSTLQLIIGFIFSLVFLLFTSIARPFRRTEHDDFSLLCNFSLAMVFFFSLVLKMGVLSGEVEDSLSDELRDSYTFDPALLSVALMCTLLASVIVGSVLAVYQVYQSRRAAARAAAAEREASIARGRLSHPPTATWELRQGNRYCVFLSHFKQEAGSDARYLSDLIKRKTGCAAYLDSNDLVDLRALFNEGVHKSDVLVVLATKSVLTRPWCLLEMWEAALNEIPIVLCPVVGGGWTPDDARALLSDLVGQMQSRNPSCMADVMDHVGRQGVTEVREVEDVLLAHIGLVSSLERPGRPASMDLDRRLCAHLRKDVADLASWLPAHKQEVEQRLSVVSWQPWGSDNQIIASVQTLIGECALALGRAQPEWADSWGSSSRNSRASRRTSEAEELNNHLSHLNCLCWPGHSPGDNRGRLLIICTVHECGGQARLLQRRLEDELQCDVVIGSNDVNTWRSEVDSATRGVVLLQTQSVLRNAVRLLQLFEAVQQRHPVACVHVVGGGYDFAKVKPLLLSLSNELPPGEMATLRTELTAHGSGIGQLGNCLSEAVCHMISVFVNPAASDLVMEAAIEDIMDKLERGAELLETGAIAMTMLRTSTANAGVQSAIASP